MTDLIEILKSIASDFVAEHGAEIWRSECKLQNCCPDSASRRAYLHGLYQGYLSALVVMDADDCESETISEELDPDGD